MRGKFSITFSGLKMDGKHWQASVLDGGATVSARGATPMSALHKLLLTIGDIDEPGISTESNDAVRCLPSGNDKSGDGA